MYCTPIGFGYLLGDPAAIGDEANEKNCDLELFENDLSSYVKCLKFCFQIILFWVLLQYVLCWEASSSH